MWVSGHKIWTTEYPNIYSLIYLSTGYNYIQMTYGGNRLYRFSATSAGIQPPDPAMVAVGYTLTELI